MKTFKEYLTERNKLNKQKKDTHKWSNLVSRVDPVNRQDPWKKTSYSTGDWGSAPDSSGKIKVGDTVGPGLKVQAKTEPIAFATPGRPNAMYAFPRKDKAGKVTSLAATYEPGKKGTIYTTKKGIKALQSSPVQINKASSKGWERRNFNDEGEVVSGKNPENASKTVIKNPEAFVKSQYNVVQRTSNKSIRKAIRKDYIKGQKEGRPVSVMNQISEKENG